MDNFPEKVGGVKMGKPTHENPKETLENKWSDKSNVNDVYITVLRTDGKFGNFSFIQKSPWVK